MVGLRFALITALFGLPALSTAQEPSDVLPAEVMQLLLQTSVARETFELRVGAAPSGFPIMVLPPGTTVRAAAIAESLTVVVGEVESFGNEGLSQLEVALGDQGWKSVGPTRRAFVRDASAASLTLCRGTDFVTLSSAPSSTSGDYVRAIHQRDDRRPCVDRPGGGFGDIVLPALTPPPGARVVGGGGGSSGGGISGAGRDWRSSQQLVTTLSARDVAEHYRRQLTDAGWRQQGRTEAGDAEVVALSGSTRNGQPITALLIITPLDGAEEPTVDAFLRIVRHE